LTHNRRLILILALLLSACGALTPPDDSATMRAENAASIMEATTIAQSYATDEARIQGTAEAGGATIAAQSSINRQLILTERALIPPTPVRQVGVAAQGVQNLNSGTPDANVTQFINTGVATSLRKSDGCADSFVTQISEDAPMIYVNTKAVSIRGGTVMGVEWQANGQLVAQETWTVPGDEINYCIYFYLDPARVPFTPGAWAVTLSANGQPIQPTVQFSIVPASSGG
jgi:hypothetical protein